MGILTGGVRLEAVFLFYFSFPFPELKPGTEVDCGSRVPLVSTGKYSVTTVVRSRRLICFHVKDWFEKLGRSNPIFHRGVRNTAN